MKRIFKQTKVVYDAHMQEYKVYYKNWFFWILDQNYKVNTHLNNEKAKELAIARAKNMLDIVEVYRSSDPVYYI